MTGLLILKVRDRDHADALKDLIYAKILTTRDCGKALNRAKWGGMKMLLSWTITFLVIAIIAAILGFAGIAGAAAGIAKILFVVFLAVFIVSLFLGRRSV